MFRMSYTKPYEGEVKTLKLTSDPLRRGLGHYQDVDGKLWDINAIYGGKKPYVCARPVDNSPYYSTASDSHSNGSHEWIPYYVEVVEQASVV